MVGGWKLAGIGALACLLGACTADPRDMGITGPFPDGVVENTLTQNRSRADLSADQNADTPGIGGDALSNFRYVPALRPNASTGIAGPRYFGYNY